VTAFAPMPQRRSTSDGAVSRVLEVLDGHGRCEEHGLILTCAYLHAIAVMPPEPPRRDAPNDVGAASNLVLVAPDVAVDLEGRAPHDVDGEPMPQAAARPAHRRKSRTFAHDHRRVLRGHALLEFRDLFAMQIAQNERVQARSRHLIELEDPMTVPVLDPRIRIDSTNAHAQRKTAANRGCVVGSDRHGGGVIAMITARREIHGTFAQQAIGLVMSI
jgi:hypothetical protein